jgi:pectinesterase
MAARARKKLRLPLVVVSHSVPLLVLLLLGEVAACAAAASSEQRVRLIIGKDGNNNNANSSLLDAAAVERHCAGTLHRAACASTLAAVPNLAQKPLREVISGVVGRAAAAVRASSSHCSEYLRRGRLRVRDRLALADCVELCGGAVELLGAAAAGLLSSPAGSGTRTAVEESVVAGVQTALSAALTNQYTCLDGFAGPSAAEDGRVRPYVQGRIYHVAHLVSNSLAMLRRLPRRRREEEGYGRGFPAWGTGGCCSRSPWRRRTRWWPGTGAVTSPRWRRRPTTATPAT